MNNRENNKNQLNKSERKKHTTTILYTRTELVNFAHTTKQQQQKQPTTHRINSFDFTHKKKHEQNFARFAWPFLRLNPFNWPHLSHLNFNQIHLLSHETSL